MGGKRKKAKVRATTKARGKCKQGCGIFVGYGADEDEAKAESEGKCVAAGCHTPGGYPYNCSCGHTSIYWYPN
jgi:hypothetical protein